VAYAVGKRAGTAVVRNRIRRRLRAAVVQQERELLPGGAYMLGADRAAMTTDFATLTAAVGTLLRGVAQEHA
jgi:ribonuclease P protein component